jgi:hypothetical protein
MTFWEWCKQHNFTESEAKSFADRKDDRFQRAYKRFKRPAYHKTREQKGDDRD